jgi:phenylacetate-CoA ligase
VQCEPASPEVDAAMLHGAVEHALREQLGIRVRVEVVEPGTVPRSEGKAVRVVESG